MKQSTTEISRKEQAIFSLIHTIDDLCALKAEFSIQDMDQIEKVLDKLSSAIRKKRELARWVFPCIV